MDKKKPAPRVCPVYAKAFQARMKILREGADMKQADIARALGIELDAYKKYENRPRSLLPHDKVQAFIEVVGIGHAGYCYLFTGKIAEHAAKWAPSPEVRKNA